MRINTTDFRAVTIILPAINETFSFEQTVDVIIEECNQVDICEFIAVVCNRTTQESLAFIEKSKEKCEKLGYHFISYGRPCLLPAAPFVMRSRLQKVHI